MKKTVPIYIILFFFIFLCGCADRSFENETTFEKWLTHKKFTSVGNDKTQMDYAGNLNMPVGNVELKFKDGLMIYQACSPQSYNVYKDDNKWVVSFKQCGTGDIFELVIPITGDCYIRSADYDIDEQLNAHPNAISKLDALASKKIVDGPTMSIETLNDSEFNLSSTTLNSTPRSSFNNVPESQHDDEEVTKLSKLYTDTDDGIDSIKRIVYYQKLQKFLNTTALFANSNIVDSLKEVLEINYSQGFILGNTAWSHVMGVHDNFIQCLDNRIQLKKTFYFDDNLKNFQHAHYNEIHLINGSTDQILLVGCVYYQSGEGTYSIQYLNLGKSDLGLKDLVFKNKLPYYMALTENGNGFSFTQISPKQFSFNANDKTYYFKWNGSKFDAENF
jgi:hypothetical protein